jgi:hypothetical protein
MKSFFLWLFFAAAALAEAGAFAACAKKARAARCCAARRSRCLCVPKGLYATGRNILAFMPVHGKGASQPARSTASFFSGRPASSARCEAEPESGRARDCRIVSRRRSRKEKAVLFARTAA